MRIKNIINKIVLTISTLFLIGLIIPVGAAEFRSSPSNFTFKQGCLVSFDVIVDTADENSNAADIEISYNPSEVTIQDSNPSKEGVQVETGEAYEFYVSNDVDQENGIIRVASASFDTILNGEKRFITVYFRNNPGVTNTEFEIFFEGPEATLDSNIARSSDNNDILTNVTNAEFSFEEGSCENDTEPPTIELLSPKPREKNVNPSTDISISLNDNFSGVAINSVVVIIEGNEYSVSNGNLEYNGSPDNYILTITLENILNEASPITVIVSAEDLEGNQSDYSETFFTWASNEQPEAAICEVSTVNNCQIDSETIPLLNDIDELRDDFLPTELNSFIDSTGVLGFLALLLLIYLVTGSIYLASIYGINSLLNSAIGSLETSKYNLTGRIINSSNMQPLNFALVTAMRENGRKVYGHTLTDKNGYYKLELSAGKYQIDVKYGDNLKEYKENLVELENHTVNNLNITDDFNKPSSKIKFATLISSTFRITLLIGLILSIMSTIILSSTFNTLILVTYLILISIPILKK